MKRVMKVALTNKTEKPKNKISNKSLIGIILVYLLLDILLVTNIIIPSFSSYVEEKEYIKDLKEATIKVELKDNLNVSFYSDLKVSDFITSINGKITKDYKVDTKSLGPKKIIFEYINDENIRIPYSFNINVVDDIPPSIWLDSTYTIRTTYKGDLLEDITCADNLDDKPKCEIIGNYDTTKVGNYKLTYKATDNVGNTTIKEFTLRVKEPKKPSTNTEVTPSKKYHIKDVIKDHKTSNTKIGIDISSWQGDIDFQKVKDSGVEFVFIRVGSTKGINKEYFVDKKFINNIKGFNSVDIPVGIYFYSYANSKEAAIKDAKWVLKQIKGYKVDLPIAYDWESWSFYNVFNQSFYSTSVNAKAFLDTISNAGYDGLLYSSKSYLERVWFDIGYDTWLAHYTKQTSYKGPYKYWQLCSNGKVPGINGNVDINIYYE